jgi:metal-sulfur cluster biosynthetic enzyme
VTPKPADIVTNATICSGATYTWLVNSVAYTASQTVTITNDGCTANQVLNLTVTPKPADIVTNATICSGATYTWSVNSVAYTTSQTVTITNDGCTANQVLNLTVTPKPATVTTNATICSGATYTWSVNGVAYTTSQSVTITNDGCTANQVLNLTVTPKPADIVTNATICSGATYTWSVNSVAYTASQSVTITNDGCTANQVLNLTVTPKPATVTTNASICPGATYTWSVNNVAYTTSQTVTITNDGCTANQVLVLTVTPLPAQPTMEFWQTATFNSATCSWVVSGTQPAQPVLTVDVLLDGYYITGSNPALMRPARYTNLVESGSTNPGAATDVDVITVELWSPTNLGGVAAYSVSPILQTNGSVQCTFPVGALVGSYYIVVNHRSSISVWSANPVNLSTTSTYNFKNNPSSIYSDVPVQGAAAIPSVHNINTGLYGMWMGEMNDDGFIDGIDYLPFVDDVNLSSYDGQYLLDGDFNGDAYVDAVDYGSVFDYNSNQGVYTQRPY